MPRQSTDEGRHPPAQQSPSPTDAAAERAFDELALAERERLLRAIFEAEPECVKVLGVDGSLRMMNPAGLRMVEADSFEDVSGRPVYLLIAEEHRAAFRALTKRVFGGDTGTLEFRITGLKGTPRWLETHMVPLRDARGAVTGTLGITRDITNRLLADAALRESERNFRMLFEQATEGIFVCDDELRLLDVNPAGCQMTGRAREELLGLGVSDLIDPEERSRLPQEVGRLASAQVITSEWRVMRRDGSRFLAEVTGTRLPDGRFQAFVRDITERTALQAQVLQAQKMEGIGRLAGGIAHDFNNLLTVINGAADLAIASVHAASPVRSDLEQIRLAGERAAALTRQLLAMSRQQILQPAVIALNAVIRGMEGMLRRVIGEDVALVLSLADGLGHVRADPRQLEQVVLNLAANARDAMPNGGTLTIETRDADGATAAGSPPGRPVMLTVRDTGVGMDDAARKRVFEPFFTTKEVGKGTGLGLSTVYGIVKQSGGSVWVDSRPHGGTTFTIALPRVDERLGPGALAEVVTDARGIETILVVEDEYAVRTLTRRILESAGYRVVAAGSGAEALELLGRMDNPIHLLLTDVVMPGMNGRELADRVVGLRPDIKVLYTTGYTSDALLRRGVLDATSIVVTKPFTALELRRKIRDLLDA